MQPPRFAGRRGRFTEGANNACFFHAPTQWVQFHRWLSQGCLILQPQRLVRMTLAPHGVQQPVGLSRSLQTTAGTNLRADLLCATACGTQQVVAGVKDSKRGQRRLRATACGTQQVVAAVLVLGGVRVGAAVTVCGNWQGALQQMTSADSTREMESHLVSRGYVEGVPSHVQPGRLNEDRLIAERSYLCGGCGLAGVGYARFFHDHSGHMASVFCCRVCGRAEVF